MNILGTLEKPTGGKVLNGGKDVSRANGRWPISGTATSDCLSVSLTAPEFNAVENVMMPVLISGLSRAEAASMAEDLLDRLGLSARLKHRVGELSGRAAKSRSGQGASASPEIVLADEPSGNLDSRTGRTLHEHLVSLNESLGLTMIIVTHNQELASMMHRVLRLKDAHLREDKDLSGVCSTASV